MVEQIVTQGDFRFDFKTGKPVSHIGQRQYLDPDIANEGQRAVILSDGETVSYNPPAVKAVIPDWSEIKSIKHYFHRVGYRPFPAWFYHPVQEPRLLKDAEEAGKLGIIFRKASFEEKGKYGRDYVWDTEGDCEWSPIPYPGTVRFDPNNPGGGKEVVRRPPDPKIAQNELLAELVPTVTAAVVTALKAGGAPSAPAHVDAKEWEEFLAFQAWKKTQEAVSDRNGVSLNGETERASWEAQAREIGLKVDGRWAIDRLKKEVEQKIAEEASKMLAGQPSGEVA